MLSFNFRMNTPPAAMTWTIGDEMIILRLEGVSVTNNPMWLTLLARFAGGGVWNPVFQNDNQESVLTAVNFMTSPWYLFAALGNSNVNNSQMGRLITNINSNVYKVSIPQAENWDFTNSVVMKYFSIAAVAPFYFSGSIGRIDYVGGTYDNSASTTVNDNVLEWHLPCKLSITRHANMARYDRPRSHSILPKQNSERIRINPERLQQSL